MNRVSDAPYTADEIAARGASLKEDMERIATGWRPTKDDIADMPALHVWFKVVDGAHKLLSGYCFGHRRLGRGAVCTAPVVWLDEDLGTVRTEGRWYGLGERAEPKTGVGFRP
jgi:hypothetical protein